MHSEPASEEGSVLSKEDLEDGIRKYENLIEKQNEEIIKCEALIDQLLKHLTKQKETKSEFLKDKNNLKKKLAQMEAETAPPLIVVDLTDEDNDVEAPQKNGGDTTAIYTTVTKKKQKKNAQTAVIPGPSNLMVPVHEAPLERRTILKIVLGRDMFVSGTGGLLLKVMVAGTFPYVTEQRSNISYIDVQQQGEQEFLYAVSLDRILVFNTTMKAPLRAVMLPGIANIHEGGSQIFLTTADKSVSRFDKRLWSLSEMEPYRIGPIRLIFPAGSVLRHSFVSLENSTFLRAVTTSDFIQANCLSDIRGVLPTSQNYFLCYSEDTLWSIDDNCCITDSLTFFSGIRIVSFQARSLMVLDGTDTLHLFSLAQPDSLHNKLFERSVDSGVSAICLHNNKAFLAIGADVFRIDYGL